VSFEPTPVSLGAKPQPERLAVAGVGNALLDITTEDHDGIHERLGLVKGAMNLVDLERAREIYSHMGPARETSGGSAANTIAGVAALGGTAGFAGKVSNDNFGEVFAHDLKSLGAEVDLAYADAANIGTGRCHVFVTDDAQRTMATYLGAANQLQPDDVGDDLFSRADITFLEGYLFDLPPAKEAFRKVIRTAHDHDGLVALTLSDSFCVERHRDDFLALVSEDVDILIANLGEITSLFQVATLEAALSAVEELGILTVVTYGPDGAMVTTMGERHHVDAPNVPDHLVLDQNGAGDVFAAGFLYGLSEGADPVEATRLGAVCAGEIITHFGPRPETDLRALCEDAGLL